MDCDLKMDLSTKFILHWNCRGFTQLPDALRTHGRRVQEIYLKWNNLTFLKNTDKYLNASLPYHFTGFGLEPHLFPQVPALPSWLASLSSLTNLYLPYNFLTSIPDEIVDLVSLKVLDISHNRLEELPPSVGRLSGLVVLVVNNNYLKCLPPELCMLKSLQTLEASSNSIRSLPLRLDECVALRDVVLDDNKLVSLPNTIVYLHKLAVLYINNNRLRYLPAVPFACRPYLRFTDNVYLTYIPYQLGHEQSEVKIAGDLWDLQIYGCFSDLSATHRPKLVAEKIIVYEDHHLVLPPPLRVAVSSSQIVITPLRELALRAAYDLGYEHSGNRRVKQPAFDLYQILPSPLQVQLLQGPAALCQLNSCRRPLFEFAIIWVVPTPSISHNRQGMTSILAVVFFCSVSCSRMYAQHETALNARQVSWNVLD